MQLPKCDIKRGLSTTYTSILVCDELLWFIALSKKRWFAFCDNYHKTCSVTVWWLVPRIEIINEFTAAFKKLHCVKEREREGVHRAHMAPFPPHFVLAGCSHMPKDEHAGAPLSCLLLLPRCPLPLSPFSVPVCVPTLNQSRREREKEVDEGGAAPVLHHMCVVKKKNRWW